MDAPEVAFEAFWPWSGRSPGKSKYTVEEALRYCFSTVSHYENFPVALRPLGRERAAAMAAVYAFARQADDFADEPCFRPHAERLLHLWESQLHLAMDPEARPGGAHPVFVALRWAARRFDLPKEHFLDLLSAFRQDLHKARYQTWDEVLDYCRRSANPVGRLVLRIFGLDEGALGRYSDAVCTALQLVNFWQDLSVDRRRGRLYVPMEVLEQHGLLPEELDSPPDGRHGDMVAELCDRTFALFWKGLPLLWRAPFPAKAYIGLVSAGGNAVLAMVRLLGANVLRVRPALDGRWWMPLVKQRVAAWAR